jgi:hypothetical protein
LFRLSVIDDCNNVANLISYSELNFDHIICLSKLNLILKILVVRRSKCHACVQAKQPHKHFKSVEEELGTSRSYSLYFM